MRTLLTTIVLMLSPSLHANERPNFLIFMADDMSFHDLGCYGNKDIRTPHLDGLAKQGVRFTRCYNSSPMCAPTRMSLFTGLHPVRHGGYPNHSRVHDAIRSLPHFLKELGYTSAILGKRHEKPLKNFPFLSLGGKNHDHGTGLDLDLSKSREFIDAHHDEPWCLVITSNQPHTPWTRGNPAAYPPEKLTLPSYLVDTPETRSGLSKYYAEITYMDNQVGTVLRHLEESGEANDTLVLFLGEQGSNFPYCKWTCYETGLRSAAIARWPERIPPGSVADQMIQYVDILPTFIDLAGGDPESEDFDGKSARTVLMGGETPIHRFIFGLQTSRGIFSGPQAFGIRTVRDDRYRLIWNLNAANQFSNTVTAGKPVFKSWKKQAEQGDLFADRRVKGYITRPELELYDLTEDPWEMNNLADEAEHADRRQSLLSELKAWMRQQGDQGQVTEANAHQRIPGKN